MESIILNSSKSIFISSPGRTGVHWLGLILKEVLNIQKEIGLNYKYSDYSMKKFINEVKNRGINSKYYIKHIPIEYLKPIDDILDVIIMIRDPRDIVVSSFFYILSRSDNDLSITMENFGEPNYQKLGFESLFQKNLNGNLHHKEWFYSYLKNRNNVRHFIIKYEDMLKNGPQSIIRMLRWFGRDFDEEMVSMAFDKFSFNKLSDGREPGVEDNNHHFRKGIIGDWKNYFTEKDNNKFYSQYRDIMEAIDYRKN